MTENRQKVDIRPNETEEEKKNACKDYYNSLPQEKKDEYYETKQKKRQESQVKQLVFLPKT